MPISRAREATGRAPGPCAAIYRLIVQLRAVEKATTTIVAPHHQHFSIQEERGRVVRSSSRKAAGRAPSPRKRKRGQATFSCTCTTLRTRGHPL